MAASTDIASQVASSALAAGVDPQLALAVAQAESSLNPNAVNRSSGAYGVMQLNPSSFPAGLSVAQNIQTGVSYLGQLLGQFGGDVSQALAAYNWGPGNLTRALSQYGSNWLAHAPAETQNYVTEILNALGEAPPPTTVDSGDSSSSPNPLDGPSDGTAGGSGGVSTGLGVGTVLALLAAGVAFYFVDPLGFFD